MWNEVIVGNIGTVYAGEDGSAAEIAFLEYEQQSQMGYGRAAGEYVTWLCDGEITRQHFGTLATE